VLRRLHGLFRFVILPSGICYATAMQDCDFPQIVIDEFMRLSKQIGTPIEDRPEFHILWEERLGPGGAHHAKRALRDRMDDFGVGGD